MATGELTSQTGAPDLASPVGREYRPSGSLRGPGGDVAGASPTDLIRVMHADLYGRAKSKQVLAGGRNLHDPHELRYCESSLAETLEGEPLTGGSFPADRGHPDLVARPEPSTRRRVPWETGSTWMLADLVAPTPSGDVPAALCQREAVRRAVDALAAAGFAAEVALELEFYLVWPDGTPRPKLYSELDGMVYTVGRRSDPLGVIATMQRHLAGLDIPITTASREFSPGQFEINLAHRDPLGAADDAFVFKEAVKEIAGSFGLEAVFMARPFQAHAGSSMHLHLSLQRDGVNAFADNPDLRLRCANGLAAHASALTAIASSTVNSYKRLNGGGVVSVHATIGNDDREAWVRFPAEGGSASRLEWRGGDAASNPYLLVAAAIHAALDGMVNPSEPSPTALPGSLRDALDALVADAVLAAGLRREMIDTYVALKRDEADRFARTVTDWEWNAYHIHV